MHPPGKYARVAELIGGIGAHVLELAGVGPGTKVLDVACGTGHASIPAAQAGARATGLDPSPELLEVARERAADYMVEVEWVEGDPQDLPFEAASFDAVVSTFGHMFAPDHERTAAELRRVCRAGGSIAVACWTPAASLDGDERATMWGTEEHIAALLGPGKFRRETLDLEQELGDLRDDPTLSFSGEYLLAVIPT